MSNIKRLLEIIEHTPDCKIMKSSEMPSLPNEIQMPDDLKEFYRLCGGAILFENQEYGFQIVEPQDFVLANPVIVGELCEEDISSKWYIICKDSNQDCITIDLSKERNGRCYDSFWDRHGVVGECSIVANSFTDLVINLLNAKGKNLYWLEDTFNYLGDAYDDI